MFSATQFDSYVQNLMNFTKTNVKNKHSTNRQQKTFSFSVCCSATRHRLCFLFRYLVISSKAFICKHGICSCIKSQVVTSPVFKLCAQVRAFPCKISFKLEILAKTMRSTAAINKHVQRATWLASCNDFSFVYSKFVQFWIKIFVNPGTVENKNNVN